MFIIRVRVEEEVLRLEESGLRVGVRLVLLSTI
jgi:hypothetical protein